jgi:hypothetical protein
VDFEILVDEILQFLSACISTSVSLTSPRPFKPVGKFGDLSLIMTLTLSFIEECPV